MNWKSTAATSNLVLRVPLGLAMIMIGIAAYRDFAPFTANVTDGLGWISPFAYVYAFFLPALFIFGGGLLAVGRYSFISALTGGVALASVPVGLLLKTIMSGLSLPEMLAASYPTIVWMIAFYIALNPFPDQEISSVESQSE